MEQSPNNVRHDIVGMALSSSPSNSPVKRSPGQRGGGATPKSTSEKTTRQRRGHEVFLRLCAMIETGELQIGDTLPSERDLAARFRVGRTAIREGVLKLAVHGWVKATRGTRPEVAQVNLKSVFDQAELCMQLMAGSSTEAARNLDEARLVFQRLAVRDASLLASTNDIGNLRKSIDQQQSSYDPSGLMDVKFCRQIVDILGNPIISAAFDAMTSAAEAGYAIRLGGTPHRRSTRLVYETLSMPSPPAMPPKRKHASSTASPDINRLFLKGWQTFPAPRNRKRKNLEGMKHDKNRFDRRWR